VVLCSIGAWNNFEESESGINEISRISSVIHERLWKSIRDEGKSDQRTQFHVVPDIAKFRTSTSTKFNEAVRLLHDRPLLDGAKILWEEDYLENKGSRREVIRDTIERNDRPSPNFELPPRIPFRDTSGPREIHDRRARGMFWGSSIRSS